MLSSTPATTLFRRADCLLSSLDFTVEERNNVYDVLKANYYTKTYLRNCQKPATTSDSPEEKEPATGFAVFPYIQGVREPIKRIFNSRNTIKVAQKPFRLWGILFLNQRIPLRRNNEPMLFILFRAMTVITSISDKQNVSLVHV